MMSIKRKLTLTQLSALIDTSYDEQLRSDCVKALEEFKYKQTKIFEILEKCILKDKSSLVKISALKLLAKKYPDKSWYLLKWVANQNNSMSVLAELISITKNKEYNLSDKYDVIMEILLKRVARTHNVCMKESKFFLDLLFLLDKNAPRLHWADVGFWFLTKGQSILNVKGPESDSIYAVENGHIIALAFPFFELGELPESIGLLSKLEYLDIRGNELKLLPNSFSSLSNLKELVLYENNLESELDFIYEFAKHHYSNNYEKEGVISSEAPVLGLLEIFKGDPLEKIENSIDLANMECLNFFKLDEYGHVIGIYIDNPGFRGVIPKQICDLNFLEELRLAHGSASRIPEEIGLLTSLRELDLYDNRITEIPKSISNLTNLQHLNLSFCSISRIPEDIELPNSLKVLQLEGNRITEIPEELDSQISTSYKAIDK